MSRHLGDSCFPATFYRTGEDSDVNGCLAAAGNSLKQNRKGHKTGFSSQRSLVVFFFSSHFRHSHLTSRKVFGVLCVCVCVVLCVCAKKKGKVVYVRRAEHARNVIPVDDVIAGMIHPLLFFFIKFSVTLVRKV